MTTLTPILAASEFEIGIGIIIVIFWAIAAVVGKIKNALTPKRPGELSPVEKMQQQIAEQLRQMHGDAALPPIPPPIPQRPQPQQRQKQPKQQRQSRQRPTQRQVFAEVPPPPKPMPVERPTVAPPTVSKPPVSVTAPVIRRWLKPATLRQQFILTELFQPPMSMRDERH